MNRGRKPRSFKSNKRRIQSRNSNRRLRAGNRRKNPTFDPSQFINKNPVKNVPMVYEAKHTFGDFGLDGRVLKILSELGIKEPTPIQDQTIPLIVKGSDVVGIAETGTGKTAAFLLPLIQKTISNNGEVTLILAPTRELAIQINNELRKFVGAMKIFSTVCVGGVNIRPQIRSLSRKNHFVIGTPGRVLDHIRRGTIKPGGITNVVLDEADRMLDMGFIHDMKKILSDVPAQAQTLFFSATMDQRVENLVGEFLNNPVSICVKKTDVASSVFQDVVPFVEEDKYTRLLEILALPEVTSAMIFGEMKYKVQRLSDDLNASGVMAEAIHGNKSHGQRQRALKSFKDGKARVLVATDVVARGIHVDNVSHVINYDLPQTFEDYTHRIGRTGRGDKTGKALTFVPKR